MPGPARKAAGGGSAKGGSGKALQAKIAAKFGKSSSQTGGRGSVRRKFKAPPKSSLQDDKRLQGQLKKLNVNPIPAIEEVNLFKDDNTVVHFTKPKVQAEIASNTYVISGQCETKKLEELIPQILPQLGREHIDSLKDFAKNYNMQGPEEDDDDIPVLVDDNFDAVANSDLQNNEKTDDNEKNDDANAAAADAGAAAASGGDKNEDATNDAAAAGGDKQDEKQDDAAKTEANKEDAAAATEAAPAEQDKDKDTATKPDADESAAV